MNIRYGTEATCPNCQSAKNFYRSKTGPEYICRHCSHQVNPLYGTPFYNSHIPLQKWFYAIYLFTTPHHGDAVRELQGQLGVSYKTAEMMSHCIREYMRKLGSDKDNGNVKCLDKNETCIT